MHAYELLMHDQLHAKENMGQLDERYQTLVERTPGEKEGYKGGGLVPYWLISEG